MIVNHVINALIALIVIIIMKIVTIVKIVIDALIVIIVSGVLIVKIFQIKNICIKIKRFQKKNLKNYVTLKEDETKTIIFFNYQMRNY